MTRDLKRGGSKLPLLLSVPHAGLTVPSEVKSLCVLSEQEVAEDGDVGARQIYALESEVEFFVTTEVARAIVDQNRAEDDFRRDGVIKTHTCWDVPVYREPLSDALKQTLIEKYHRPYHQQLVSLATQGPVLGIDCHTMAAAGPPVGPDPGKERPAACLSDAHGTLPKPWFLALARCLEEALGKTVSLNDPFQGGYITRTHAAELPWVQLELSRAPYASFEEKGERIGSALRAWCSWYAEQP
ncbi:MAG: N-formylglutamate amidohydrolase [Candidatus Eisenbacteria bacterium]|uniref:N-formylglutamate amidohydrolase n=1 Tax=Eiseniibacteriota bacterium TaxID=2212470 RepID=A0A7Y2H2A6_UNCEI|nr:N-formylglutamate amidohydrolase [Candidatus Eisenbacteria bacterium]